MIVTGDWWLPTPGARPTLLLASSVAIYGCVPELDQMPLVWAPIVIALVVELVSQRRTNTIIFVLLTGLLLWAGLYGATGRGSAVVGAWFAMWPLVILPVVALVRPALRDDERRQWLIVGIGATAAITVARSGGIASTLTPAFIAVAVAAPASFITAVAISPRH